MRGVSAGGSQQIPLSAQHLNCYSTEQVTYLLVFRENALGTVQPGAQQNTRFKEMLHEPCQGNMRLTSRYHGCHNRLHITGVVRGATLLQPCQRPIGEGGRLSRSLLVHHSTLSSAQSCSPSQQEAARRRWLCTAHCCRVLEASPPKNHFFVPPSEGPLGPPPCMARHLPP